MKSQQITIHLTYYCCIFTAQRWREVQGFCYMLKNNLVGLGYYSTLMDDGKRRVYVILHLRQNFAGVILAGHFAHDITFCPSCNGR